MVGRETETRLGTQPNKSIGYQSMTFTFSPGGVLPYISYQGRAAPGGTPILKLYGDVPPFRAWFFDCPLINRVSNSKIFEDFL